jgi:signal transduction histidine kinase
VSAPNRGRLSILVHEVRSSVAALAAIAETYPQARRDVATRRHLVELALAASRGIERLVTDATVASVRLEEVDVGRVVDDTVMAAVLAGGDVRGKVAPGLPSIQADPVRLRQALDNLVSNARIHSGASILVTAHQEGARVLISVEDGGPGIPLAEQERIFEAGVRLVGGRAGSGLGLPIAREIAEAHGGTLTVTSRRSRGATFTLALPFV